MDIKSQAKLTQDAGLQTYMRLCLHLIPSGIFPLSRLPVRHLIGTQKWFIVRAFQRNRTWGAQNNNECRCRKTY